MATRAYSHYQKSSLGASLTEALQDMIDEDEVTVEHAEGILKQFDKSFNAKVRKLEHGRVSVTGHLRTYNSVENVWTFILEDAMLKVDSNTHKLDKLKIVACDGSDRNAPSKPV